MQPYRKLTKWAEILGISGTQKGVSRGFSEFLLPNSSAQMSKLWQDREWLLRDEHRFCQLNDAIRRSVPEELRCLSQVVHAQRVEAHQARTYEIGGDGIVRQHDPSEITRRAMQRPIAFHPEGNQSNKVAAQPTPPYRRGGYCQRSGDS